MTDRDLMQQALEALETADEFDFWLKQESIVKALRERLAQIEKEPFGNSEQLAQPAPVQPEQEPVAWRNAAIRLGEELSSVGPDDYYNITAAQWLDWALEQQPRGKNSLTTPPAAQRKPLTDEQMWNLWNSCGVDEMNQREAFAFARAIEAAHGIKENT
jgi:hypothetical protein